MLLGLESTVLVSKNLGTFIIFSAKKSVKFSGGKVKLPTNLSIKSIVFI